MTTEPHDFEAALEDLGRVTEWQKGKGGKPPYDVLFGTDKRDTLDNKGHIETITFALKAMRELAKEPDDSMLNLAFGATLWPDDKQISKQMFVALKGNIKKEFIVMRDEILRRAGSDG